MNVNFDLDDDRVRNEIVEHAVSVLLDSRYSPTELRREIEKVMSARVVERLNETISLTVDEMLSKPIQRYDTFGNAAGEPLSIESIVRNGANAYMTENVDSQGKPSTSGWGTAKSRIEWLIESSVLNNLARDLKTEADRVRVELVKRASEAAAAVFAKLK